MLFVYKYTSYFVIMKTLTENHEKFFGIFEKIAFISEISLYLCGKMLDRLFTYSELLEITTHVADEIMRRLQPAKDDISQREAWNVYGRSIVLAAEKSGKVKVRLIGNRKLFSRTELNIFCASKERYTTKW